MINCLFMSSFFFAANEQCLNSTAEECSHGCAVVNGTEMCYCPVGYQLSENGTHCLGTIAISNNRIMLSLLLYVSDITDMDTVQSILSIEHN